MCTELELDVTYGTLACKKWGSDTPQTQKFIAIHGLFDNSSYFDCFVNKILTKGQYALPCSYCRLDATSFIAASWQPQYQ